MNQIDIYIKTNTNYDFNGDVTLTPTSCTYKDSDKVLTLEHPQDKEGRWKYIDYENVIAVVENGKKELYRIYNVIKTLYGVTAYARPLFFDLIDNVLIDVRPTLKNGQQALDILLEGTGFTGHSDIQTISTAYYIRKNIVKSILGDDENSFLNRWGGEVLLDNFDIYINNKIGSDNGVRVEFGYNLNEIEEDINIEEVTTRIIPVGANGIMLDGDKPWVDSSLIKKYTRPKTRVITFDDVKVKENSDDTEGFATIEEARQELIKRCKEYFESGLDKPVVNFKIDMINLANTTAYKDYVALTKVNKGDTITCYIKSLDIDVQARVIDFEKDCITGDYISIELGNVQDNFFNAQADVQSRVNNILNGNGKVKADMLNGTINALDTKLKALRDVAQPSPIRATIYEDRVEGSPTFGCMCLGTMGFEIADSFKPGTTEWDFKTFGTGQGFTATRIIAGILTAILIQNADQSFCLDLAESGGAKFFNNGKLAMQMAYNQLKMFNWKKHGDYIGSLGALIRDSDENKPIISLWHDLDAALSIGCQDEKDANRVNNYIEFDEKKVLGNEYPITFLKEAEGTILHLDKLVVDQIVFKGSNARISLSQEGNVGVWDSDFYVKGEKVYPGTGGHGGGSTIGGGSTLQLAVVESARKLIGKPYRYGGNYPPLGESDGTDCSGLCQWAYHDNGINISRTTYTQINEGIEVTENELQPGDLIFPYGGSSDNHHVFMYSGESSSGGHMCVEAYATGYPIRECKWTWTSTTRARRIITS